MKAPITSFNGWLLAKITAFLATKEGCLIYKTEYTADGARTVFTDTFGFRYEVSIKTIGRTEAKRPQFNLENQEFQS